MNFMADEIDAAFTLTPAGAHRDDHVADAEKQRFDALLNTHLFASNPYNAPYQEAMRKPSVLDTRIRTSTEALLEVHRARIAIERLPHATPLQPVRLFEGYHYNGHFMVFRAPGGMRPLTGFDAATTVQRPWGASDAHHVAVRGEVIATDPAAFRVTTLPNSDGDAFYRDNKHVYGNDRQVIDGADPKSFKFVAGCYARDKHRWYTVDGAVIDDVGPEGKVDNRLYYYRNAMLISPRSVYMGRHRLAVDAATFEIKRIERVHRPRMSELRMLWFADKAGDGIIHDDFMAFDDSQSPVLQRTVTPETLWEELKAKQSPRYAEPHLQAAWALDQVTPKSLEETVDRERFADQAAAFFAEHTDQFLALAPYNDTFWGAVNNYFYACWNLGRHRELLDLYERVRVHAWWKPYIFHHTACAFTATGDLDRAVAEVRLALACGYDKIDAMLADPDLAALAGIERFEKLKAHRDAHKDTRRQFLPLEVLQSLASRDGDFGRLGIDNTLNNRFYVPGEAHITSVFVGSPETELEYRALLLKVIDDIIRGQLLREDGPPRLDDDFYLAIKDIIGVSPACHLIGAVELFAEGWFWVDMKRDDLEPRTEFIAALNALHRMKAALAADASAATDPLWLQVSLHPAIASFAGLADRQGE